MDNWEKVWSNKKVDISDIDKKDKEKVFLSLKKASGYDLAPDMAFKTFYEEYCRMKDLLKIENKDTVYEVGAGPGGNIFLFQIEGFEAAGCDYSQALVEDGTNLGVKNLSLDSAESFPIEPAYDCVIAGGVFGYLVTEEKALIVLERMYKKAKKSICVKRVLNKETKDELIAKRRATEPDYDEKYKDLPKLYISKQFFEQYAKAKNINIYIENTYMEGYWNNGYTYDVYLYK